MSRFTLFFILLLSLAAGALIASSAICFASGAFETGGNVRWIVFASRQNVDEAIGLARRFGSEFGPPTVMSSTNGWYAVAAGPVTVPNPAALKKRLSDVWWPQGLLLDKGADLRREGLGSPEVSESSRLQLLTRNRMRLRRRAWRFASSPKASLPSAAADRRRRA